MWSMYFRNMTSSCTTTTAAGQPEIPGYDVIAADNVDVDDTTMGESTKPKLDGKSRADVISAAGTPAEAVTEAPGEGVELRSASSEPEKRLWRPRDRPRFQGNENYGFEWAKWAQAKKSADSKQQ